MFFEEIVSLGWGECAQRGELGPRRNGTIGPVRTPWFFDNKAYSDWKLGQPFNTKQYLQDLQLLPRLERPDFIVVPDIVAGGLDSLRFSLEWVPKLCGMAPLYLVVQDGQTEADIMPHLPLFAGIFVGGADEWKLATGERWVEFAHENEKRCHIGRVGAYRKARWAKRIGTDSIDSCYPLFGRWEFERFKLAVLGTQGDFFD